MKRMLSLFLALAVLLSAGAAFAEANDPEVLSCPQAGFSTRIPAGASWVYRDGDVYVWLEDEDGIQACLRVMDKGAESEYASIGRVIAVRRRCGLGSAAAGKTP